MTGSLQVKNGMFYMVINTYEGKKRKLRWLSTGLSEQGNKRKAQQNASGNPCRDGEAPTDYRGQS